MMRKGIGAGRVLQNREKELRTDTVSQESQEATISTLRILLEQFKAKILEFSSKYKKEIQSDPNFRNEFTQICNSVGVDTIQSTKSSLRDFFFGSAEFYTDLSVQILTILLATREHNGGFLTIQECVERINKYRTKDSQITSVDVGKSVESLGRLGQGIKVERNFLILPSLEISQDEMDLIKFSLSRPGKKFSKQEIAETYRWEDNRIQRAIHTLMQNGTVWIDRYKGDTDNIIEDYYLYESEDKA